MGNNIENLTNKAKKLHKKLLIAKGKCYAVKYKVLLTLCGWVRYIDRKDKYGFNYCDY